MDRLLTRFTERTVDRQGSRSIVPAFPGDSSSSPAKPPPVDGPPSPASTSGRSPLAGEHPGGLPSPASTQIKHRANRHAPVPPPLAGVSTPPMPLRQARAGRLPTSGVFPVSGTQPARPGSPPCRQAHPARPPCRRPPCRRPLPSPPRRRATSGEPGRTASPPPASSPCPARHRHAQGVNRHAHCAIPPIWHAPCHRLFAAPPSPARPPASVSPPGPCRRSPPAHLPPPTGLEEGLGEKAL